MIAQTIDPLDARSRATVLHGGACAHVRAGALELQTG